MSIKVLVADDSITIQKVIGIIFAGDEYSLTVVDNGKTAVDKAREITPDILLIDVLMPGMTGYEVTEMIRSIPSLAAKPILLLTGSFEPFDEDKAKKCGADDFIAKPFESQQILSRVKELLELGNSRIQAAPLPPVTEVLPTPVMEDADPVYEIPVPVFEQQIEEVRAEPTSDIWSAFTPEIEAPTAPKAYETQSSITPLEDNDPDVFAIVSEEEDAQLLKTETINASPHQTGSQWIPVEENTFEFEEESIAQPPVAAFEEESVKIQEPEFGDIVFAERPKIPVAPVFVEPVTAFELPVAPPEPFAPLSDPEPAFVPAPAEPALSIPVVSPAVTAIDSHATASTALSEDQLKSVLAGISKDVIERIVWEVVPDLAETLIREAIRKIKEGV